MRKVSVWSQILVPKRWELVRLSRNRSESLWCYSVHAGRVPACIHVVEFLVCVRLLRSRRPFIGYLFETGQDSGGPTEQMVPVKGENIHLRFVGSPSEETGVPLKKVPN